MLEKIKNILSRNRFVLALMIALFTGLGVYYIGGEKTIEYLQSFFEDIEIEGPENPDPDAGKK